MQRRQLHVQTVNRLRCDWVHAYLNHLSSFTFIEVFTVANSKYYSVHCWETSRLIQITISVVGRCRNCFCMRLCFFFFFSNPMEESTNSLKSIYLFWCLLPSEICRPTQYKTRPMYWSMKSAGTNSTLNILYCQSAFPQSNKYKLYITRIHVRADIQVLYITSPTREVTSDIS